ACRARTRPSREPKSRRLPARGRRRDKRLDDGEPPAADEGADRAVRRPGAARADRRALRRDDGAARQGSALHGGAGGGRGAAAPTGVAFPTTLASRVPASVQLGCARDCLYVVTLDNNAGKPVVAARGDLRGGAAPATVTLPAAKLTTGATYRVDVRLIARVNP